MADPAKTRRVFIHRNEASAEGKVLLISDDISLAALKKLAEEKLGLKKVKKIYIASGAEVVSIDEIQQNENLYFSSGDGFYRASISGSGAEKMNVAVLGGGGVGKSAITLRFVRDFFIKNWEATIEDAYRKTVRVLLTVSRLLLGLILLLSIRWMTRCPFSKYWTQLARKIFPRFVLSG
jgi:hypothetical protein